MNKRKLSEMGVWLGLVGLLCWIWSPVFMARGGEIDPAAEKIVTQVSAEQGTELSVESELNDRITVFFSKIGDQLQANVELNRRGTQFQWVIDRPQDGTNTPIYVELEGPVIAPAKGGRSGDPKHVNTGAVITIRW